MVDADHGKKRCARVTYPTSLGFQFKVFVQYEKDSRTVEQKETLSQKLRCMYCSGRRQDNIEPELCVNSTETMWGKWRVWILLNRFDSVLAEKPVERGGTWKEIYNNFYEPFTESKGIPSASTTLRDISHCEHSAQSASTPQGEPDYRARTIYFFVTDRFHAHRPDRVYRDRDYPGATNTENCFRVGCEEESQYRKYWGGDLYGVIDKLDYLSNLGISAIWLTPLMENVKAYEM